MGPRALRQNGARPGFAAWAAVRFPSNFASTEMRRGWSLSGTCIVQRGRKFAVCAYGGVDPETGKKRYRWFSGFSTHKEADAFKQTLAHHPSFAAGAGPYCPPRLRFGDYLFRWIDERQALERIRPHTADGYRDLADRHIVPTLGHMPLARLSPPAIQALYSRLRGHLSPATVRQIAAIVHCSLEDAVRQGLAARNPADNATPPSVPEPERTVWTPEQVAAYLADAHETATPSVFAFYMAMFGTGCRPGELLGAPEEAVDLTRRPPVLHVRTTLVRAGREPVLGQPKTAKGRRIIVLPDEAAAAIKDALRWKKERRLRLGPKFRDGGTLFCTPRGRPLDRRVLRARDHMPRVRRLGLPDARIYDMRHVSITHGVAAGVDPRTMADRVGHTDPGYMMRRYAHAVTAAQERAAAVASTLLVLSKPAGR